MDLLEIIIVGIFFVVLFFAFKDDFTSAIKNNEYFFSIDTEINNKLKHGLYYPFNPSDYNNNYWGFRPYKGLWGNINPWWYYPYPYPLPIDYYQGLCQDMQLSNMKKN